MNLQLHRNLKNVQNMNMLGWTAQLIYKFLRNNRNNPTSSASSLHSKWSRNLHRGYEPHRRLGVLKTPLLRSALEKSRHIKFFTKNRGAASIFDFESEIKRTQTIYICFIFSKRYPNFLYIQLFWSKTKLLPKSEICLIFFPLARPHYEGPCPLSYLCSLSFDVCNTNPSVDVGKSVMGICKAGMVQMIQMPAFFSLMIRTLKRETRCL